MMNPEYDFTDEPITRIATKKEFMAHLPQPSSKDCWGSGPRQDFEKLEAVAYHQAAASEETSEIEAKRLFDAVEAATTKEQKSL